MFLRLVLLLSSIAPALITTAQTAATPAVDVSALKLPTSVVLHGKATWMSGGKEDSGTVTLTASLDGSASEEWDLSQAGTLKWTEGPLAGNRSCQSVGADGKATELSGAGCLRPVVWFAPWYTPAVAASKLATMVDVTDTFKLQGIQRLRYTIALDPPKNAKAAAAVKRLVADSAVDVDTTAETGQPASLQFDEVVAGARLDITVSFSDYRAEGTLMVPHRIKRYLQHALQADIQITSVTLQ